MSFNKNGNMSTSCVAETEFNYFSNELNSFGTLDGSPTYSYDRTTKTLTFTANTAGNGIRTSNLRFFGDKGKFVVEFDAYATKSAILHVDVCDSSASNQTITTTNTHYIWYIPNVVNYYTEGNYNGFLDLNSNTASVTYYISNIVIHKYAVNGIYQDSAISFNELVEY